MADRYWVGGTGTWDGTAGTKWATTSGGTGGASVPGGSDDVYFNAASGAAVVSIGAVNSRSIICTGFTGSFTGSSQVAVYGGLTLSATMTHTNTLQYIFAATSGTWTIASAGKTIGDIYIGNGASTATWTLSDALTVSSGLRIFDGTFNTGNFNVTCGALQLTGSTTRTLNCGSSTITVSNTYDSRSATNLTLNAGTSNFIFSSNNLDWFSDGRTFYDVSFTGTTQNGVRIYGNNTFRNLTITPQTNAAGYKTITFHGNNTVTGTFSSAATNAAFRTLFNSNTAGTQRTLSVATMGTVTNTDFKDIALTGTASPFTAPFGVGDLGNNSGITFNTQTAYWIGGTGNWTDSTKWSFSSGGSAVSGGVPQSTNSVVFDASSGTGTVTTSGAACADLTVTASQAITLSGALNVYGSLAFPSGGSFVFSNSGLTFRATTTGKTIADNAKIVGNVTFNGIGGEWTLTTSLGTANYVSIILEAGTFRTGNFNIRLAGGTSIYLSGSANTQTATRAMYLGSSTLTFIGGSAGIQSSSTNTGLTFDAGTSLLNFTSNFATIATTGLTYYDVTDSNTSGVNGVNITGANTFRNLTFVGPASAGIKIVNFAANQTVNGTFSAIGLNGDRRIAVYSNDYVTQRTITAAAVSLTDVNFNKIIGAGAATWSGTRLSNGGGNSGITFDAAKTVYWNLAAGGQWYNSNAWATSSGGTPAMTNYPLGQDTAIIEDTGLNSGATIGAGVQGLIYPNMTFATRTLPVTWALTSNVLMAGNITLSSAVTMSGSSSIYFSGNTTLISAGVFWTLPYTFTGALTISDATTFSSSSINIGQTGGTLTLNAPTTFSASGLAVATGTLNLNSHTLTAQTFNVNTGGTSNFGTGKVVLTGTGSVWSLSGTPTLTGTSDIVIGTQSGAVTFAGVGLTYSKLTLGNGTNSTAQVTITGSNTFGEISSNQFGGTLLLTAGTSQQVDNFTYAGYKDTPYNIAGGFLTSTSTTPANLTTPPTEYYGNFASSKYLTTATSDNFAPGTGDFTVEFWCKFSNASGDNSIFSYSDYSQGILIRAGGTSLSIFIANYNQTYSGTAFPVANIWTHIAVVRRSGVLRVYSNGTQLGTDVSNSSNITPTISKYVMIGGAIHRGGLDNFPGYISNLRYIVGSALYTSNFTPPVGNLTAVSGTQLLTLQSATIVDNSTNAFTITNTGSVTTTQVTPFTRPFNTNYLKVSYVNVTPTNTWNALNSLSVIGTNTGWTFSGYPGNYGYTDAGNPIENKYVTKDYVMDYYPDLIPGLQNGELYCCGYNGYGQLGDNTTVNKSSLTKVAGSNSWKSLSRGILTIDSGAIKSDGTMWFWGYSSGGTGQSSPSTTYTTGTSWKKMALGRGEAWPYPDKIVAIKDDGTLWEIQTGSAATQITANTSWSSVSCGYGHRAAVKTDGTLWMWGGNAAGQLGDGTTTSQTSPITTAGGGTNWKQVACGQTHTLAIKTDGTLWSWGQNVNGGLGDGTSSNRSSPVTTAGGGTNWKQVSCGYRATAAIKTDGTLWTWGSGGGGRIGDGTTSTRSSPVTTAGGGTNWKQVSCGNSHVAAIKTDGTLWTWGSNSDGQLGDGTTSSRLSPITTSAGGTNWYQVSCGSKHTMALKNEYY